MYSEPTVKGRKPGLHQRYGEEEIDIQAEDGIRDGIESLVGSEMCIRDRNIPRHIIITLPKIKGKERILKAAREKETVNYKGVPIRLSADFSKETLQERGGWKEVFQVM